MYAPTIPSSGWCSRVGVLVVGVGIPSPPLHPTSHITCYVLLVCWSVVVLCCCWCVSTHTYSPSHTACCAVVWCCVSLPLPSSCGGIWSTWCTTNSSISLPRAREGLGRGTPPPYLPSLRAVWYSGVAPSPPHPTASVLCRCTLPPSPLRGGVPVLVFLLLVLVSHPHHYIPHPISRVTCCWSVGLLWCCWSTHSFHPTLRVGVGPRVMWLDTPHHPYVLLWCGDTIPCCAGVPAHAHTACGVRLCSLREACRPTMLATTLPVGGWVPAFSVSWGPYTLYMTPRNTPFWEGFGCPDGGLTPIGQRDLPMCHLRTTSFSTQNRTPKWVDFSVELDDLVLRFWVENGSFWGPQIRPFPYHARARVIYRV